MRRRRTAEEVTRLLREADHDLAKGLTVSDVCRKHGISDTTYFRWRQERAPGRDDADRRCRELEFEIDRLKRLVAELLLDKQMLQDIAKKKRGFQTPVIHPGVSDTRDTPVIPRETRRMKVAPRVLSFSVG